MSEDKITASRHINASPQDIFAMLTDPAMHKHTEPSEWVGDAIDPQPIEHTGQVFGMNMYHEMLGGDYQMYNKVTVFDQPTAIAWKPGRSFDDEGNLQTGGHVYRYDISQSAGGSQVTLTFDWRDVSSAMREQIPLPPFSPAHLEQSLDTLAAAVTDSTA